MSDFIENSKRNHLETKMEKTTQLIPIRDFLQISFFQFT